MPNFIKIIRKITEPKLRHTETLYNVLKNIPIQAQWIIRYSQRHRLL